MPRNNGEGRYGGMAKLIEFTPSAEIQSGVESLFEKGSEVRPRFFASGAVLLDFACFIRKGYDPQLTAVEDTLSHLTHRPFYTQRAEMAEEEVNGIAVNQIRFFTHGSSLARLNTAVATLQGMEGRIDRVASLEENFIICQAARSSLLKSKKHLDSAMDALADGLSLDVGEFQLVPQLQQRRVSAEKLPKLTK